MKGRPSPWRQTTSTISPTVKNCSCLGAVENDRPLDARSPTSVLMCFPAQRKASCLPPLQSPVNATLRYIRRPGGDCMQSGSVLSWSWTRVSFDWLPAFGKDDSGRLRLESTQVTVIVARTWTVVSCVQLRFLGSVEGSSALDIGEFRLNTSYHQVCIRVFSEWRLTPHRLGGLGSRQSSLGLLRHV